MQHQNDEMVIIFVAVTFEVLPPNRYKLAKNYRKLLDKYGKNPEDPIAKKELEQAKVSIQNFTHHLRTQTAYMDVLHVLFK